MTSLISIAIFVAFLSGYFCLPECVLQDRSCPLNNTKFALPPTYLSKWEQCRDLCNDQGNCTSFTFYDREGEPFKNVCFLFRELCEEKEMVYCKSCVFGHECEYCSIANIAYGTDGDHLIHLITSYNESHCRETCRDTENCMYYTIYFQGNFLMPNTCVLMSASSKPVACNNCRTGPRLCNFSAQCKPNEAVIMLPSPSNHAIFTENGTQLVETMGCWAKANVLLVGGGGTGGGYVDGSSLMGGGGSGFINYATVHIPYSSFFLIWVGKGGRSNNQQSYNSAVQANGWHRDIGGYDYSHETKGEKVNPSMIGQQSAIFNESAFVMSYTQVCVTIVD